jgi:hypothetical protein
MATHRSAMGKSVDMATLASKNESVRAVGNMKVNARGDTIDSMGRVTRPITDKVNNMYAKTVGNRSAQAKPTAPQVDAPRSAAPVAPVAVVPAADPFQLNEIELELENNLEEELEVEHIKAAEKKKK